MYQSRKYFRVMINIPGWNPKKSHFLCDRNYYLRFKTGEKQSLNMEINLF